MLLFSLADEDNWRNDYPDEEGSATSLDSDLDNCGEYRHRHALYSGIIFFVPLTHPLCMCFSVQAQMTNMDWKIVFSGTLLTVFVLYCLRMRVIYMQDGCLWCVLQRPAGSCSRGVGCLSTAVQRSPSEW